MTLEGAGNKINEKLNLNQQFPPALLGRARKTDIDRSNVYYHQRGLIRANRQHKMYCSLTVRDYHPAPPPKTSSDCDCRLYINKKQTSFEILLEQ